MQKKRKIIISIAVSLGLALVATQISSNGGLQSSVIGTPETCKNGTNNYIEDCKTILISEQKKTQKTVTMLARQILTKEKQCIAFAKKKKNSQEQQCRTQLATLKQDHSMQQSILAGIVKSISQLIPKPTTPTPIPTPVPTPPPVIIYCCADNTASNFSSACGVIPNTYPRPGICIYETEVICLDPLALNYGQVGRCIELVVIPGCTDSGANNYNINATQNDGSCTYNVEEAQGCTDNGANNFDPNARIDDGSCTYDPIPECNGQGDHGYDPVSKSCQTCSDGAQNGDESDIDCGGKCGECNLGCKDPKADNYNPDPKVKDGGACTYGPDDPVDISYICDDPDALNFVPGAEGEPNRDYCQYNMICDDPDALNFVPENERKKGDKANKDVCNYCDPLKIQQFNTEIKNGNGVNVKKSIEAMEDKERECLKEEICKNGTTEVSSCTIATDYQLQYSNLQLYLTLSQAFSYKLDGVYRPISDINKTPTGDDFTRSQLVSYAGNQSKLSEIKNQCPFMRDLLAKELIKDYKAENITRIKVTQMALTMLGQYSGAIDGNRDTTYNLLQKHYNWDIKKFGYAYIAGTDRKWQVGRATVFGYNDPQDNGIGTPFMDPSGGDGINTNNTTLQGASLPLPVTMKLLCPNIKTELVNYNIKMSTQGKTDPFCQHMVGAADPMNPPSLSTGGKSYSGLAVITTCVTNMQKAGMSSCRQKHHAARVRVSSMNRTITLPLVDIGPSEGVWTSQKEATIDLTHGATVALSGDSKMLYEACFELIP